MVQGIAGPGIEVPLAEPDGGASPLRLSDFMALLNGSGRYTKCPHCPHEGQWEISMSDDNEPGMHHNPKLTVYKTSVSGGSYHTQLGMTCPRCGHFALISTYKVRQFLESQGGGNG